MQDFESQASDIFVHNTFNPFSSSPDRKQINHNTLRYNWEFQAELKIWKLTETSSTNNIYSSYLFKPYLIQKSTTLSSKLVTISSSVILAFNPFIPGGA